MTFYHGTSRRFDIGSVILSPVVHGLPIQEQGREKNLDKVFFTADLGSARIYAGRAVNSIGGEKIVYTVEPVGHVESLNTSPGTSVYMAPSAVIMGIV